MIGPAVYRVGWCHGGTRDSVHRRLTFVFGRLYPNVVRPDLYARNPAQEANDVDMLMGIVYPRSQMVTDGTGRLVAAHNAVGEPDLGVF